MGNTTIDDQVADRIRDLLREQERSQAWLARQMGLNKNALGRRLKGSIPFKASEVEQAAQVLGTTVQQLLGGGA